MNFSITDNINFKAIQLSTAETKKAENYIKELCNSKLLFREKQILKERLFDIFKPHIQEEAMHKTAFNIFEEVFAEMSLRFSELLYDIKNFPTLESFVKKLNEYKPTKDTLQSKYIYKLIDDSKNWDNETLKKIDLLTYDKLPSPKSSEYLEKIKKRIENAIKKEKLSPVIKKRMDARLKGIKFKDIAETDNISTTSAIRSVQKGIIKIQYANSNLPDKYIAKANILADLLGCKTEDIIKMYIKHYGVISIKPETIFNNIKKLTGFLKYPEEKIIKLGLRRPELLMQKPETLINNIKATASLLGCSVEVYTTAALKFSSLFYLKPETILQNVLKCAKLFNCAKETIVKSGLKQPDLFCRKPEILYDNIQKIAKSFECSEQEIIKAALLEPSLFCLKPETVINYVKKSAQLLKCSEDGFVKTAIKTPKLFMLNPETLKKKLAAGAKIFNCSEYEFGKMGLARPHLLMQNLESLNFKLKVENYYRKVKNEKPKEVPCKISKESVYTNILVYLLQKEKIDGMEELIKIKRKFDFEKFIKTFSDKIFYFEIPQDDVAEDFIKFTQETSIKTIGKNIFEFKITEPKQYEDK